RNFSQVLRSIPVIGSDLMTFYHLSLRKIEMVQELCLALLANDVPFMVTHNKSISCA
ncbi:Hypothetical predicted protein, partial [Paramuricea clavata]